MGHELPLQVGREGALTAPLLDSPASETCTFMPLDVVRDQELLHLNDGLGGAPRAGLPERWGAGASSDSAEI